MADVALPLDKFAGPANDELLKIAQLRLYPGLTDPNFLVLRARRIIFQNWIADIPGNELKILDVGGRYQPYRPLIQARAGQYVACDISRTDLVNVVGDGGILTFRTRKTSMSSSQLRSSTALLIRKRPHCQVLPSA